MFLDGGGSATVEPDGGEVSLDELERRIGEGAAAINAATCRWLELVAEFDARGGPQRAGFGCASAWLAWRCSLAPRAAREHVRVARELRELPLIRERFASGELSYSKVRVLTRAGEPAMERELLEIAESATAAQLEVLLRGFREAICSDAEARARERRHLSLSWEPDGTLSFSGNLPPEEAAVLMEALERARTSLNERIEGSAEQREGEDPGRERPTVDGVDAGAGTERAGGHEPDRADCLVAVAETVLAHGTEQVSAGQRHQLVVHVDAPPDSAARAAEPARPATEASPTATAPQEGAAQSDRESGSARTVPVLEGVGALPARTVERLACDASVVTLLERGGEPVSVGRKTRTIPSAIGRALRARDRGCRFPGCERRRYVDAHHIEHWAHGGETSLDNLVLLCRHHHRLIHEGRFTVERNPDGRIDFRERRGRLIPVVPSLRDAPQGGGRARARPPHLDRGPTRSPDHGPPIGGGPSPPPFERMDLDHAVWVLAHLAERRGVAERLQ